MTIPDTPPNERQAREWRLEIMERRREQADSFAWSVPGLAIAGQAFLLSIALAPNTAPLGRLLAAFAGFVALLATAHLMAKQVHNFDVYEAVIERDRKLLGRPGVQMDALDPQSFPANTSYVRRRWSNPRWPQHWVVAELKSVRVWLVTLVALLAVDGFLLGYAIYSLLCDDPGWLGE